MSDSDLQYAINAMRDALETGRESEMSMPFPMDDPDDVPFHVLLERSEARNKQLQRQLAEARKDATCWSLARSYLDRETQRGIEGAAQATLGDAAIAVAKL